MDMRSQQQPLDKFHKRRDRYEIPDWQREEVWGAEKKRRLIDVTDDAMLTPSWRSETDPSVWVDSWQGVLPPASALHGSAEGRVDKSPEKTYGAPYGPDWCA